MNKFNGIDELRKVDGHACEALELFRKKGLGLREAMMATSVMFGRLRHQARIDGVNLKKADALFNTTAIAITNSVVDDDGPEGN